MLTCESKIPKLPQRFQPFYIKYNVGSKLMVVKVQVTICITLFFFFFKNYISLHLKSSYAKDIKIITTNPYFTLQFSVKYPNNNNQIKITSTLLIQMQKPIKKKKKIKLSEQTQHKTENPEFSFLFLDFLGNQTGP